MSITLLIPAGLLLAGLALIAALSHGPRGKERRP